MNMLQSHCLAAVQIIMLERISAARSEPFRRSTIASLDFLETIS